MNQAIVYLVKYGVWALVNLFMRMENGYIPLIRVKLKMKRNKGIMMVRYFRFSLVISFKSYTKYHKKDKKQWTNLTQ